MEIFVIALFCAGLIVCLALNLSLIFALAAGLLIFLLYGRHRGIGWKRLLRVTWDGVRTIRELIITFVLIGMMTALWRASGTIPVIICYAAELIHPSVFLLMAFLLNCAVSMLTGSSFATAATMGVICTTMATAMEVSILLTGGAVLAGAFFGDRCSPVSTSALLVATVTKTEMLKNLRAMLRSALVPFLLACMIYAVLGFVTHHTGSGIDLYALFSGELTLHWIALLPALVIPLLALLRVKIRVTMGVSILAALPICLFLQHAGIGTLLRAMLLGYTAADPAAAAMLDGGGIVSMAEMTVIVGLAATYAGIFRETGLFDPAARLIRTLAQRTTPYCAVLCTTLVTALIACNQTLPIMLGQQLCSDLETKEQLALDLEDTAVILAPLVPWSIASTVPFAMIGAPTAAILAACYLWLQPLWRLVTSFVKKKASA